MTVDLNARITFAMSSNDVLVFNRNLQNSKNALSDPHLVSYFGAYCCYSESHCQ